MFSEFVNDAVLPALYTIAIALLPIVAGYVVDAVRKWGAKQKAEWLRTLIEEAAAASERAVEAVEQTYVSHSRTNEGRLELATAREALNMALIEAQKQLGSDAMKSLAKVLGGTDEANAALTTMIESAVGRKKTTTRSSEEFVGR